MIGEQLGPENMVAGIVLNLKTKFDKIAVWVKNCEDEEGVEQVKQAIIACVSLPEKELAIEYEVFKKIKQANNKQKPVKFNNKGYDKGKTRKEEGEDGFTRSDKPAKKAE